MERETHYRTRLKQDERSVAAGFDAGKRDAMQVVSLMRVLRDKLRISISRRSILLMMRYLYRSMEAAERHIDSEPIACGKGCSHCCNLWVDATAPEVLFAANAIRAMGGAGALESVDHALASTAGLSFTEREKVSVACPLLSDSRCTIYLARPINCRTAVSADAESCRLALMEPGDDIPVPIAWMALRQAYATALEGALHHAGLTYYAGEWNEALKIALSDPGLEQRWLSGEDVFAGIQRADREPFVTSMPGSMLYEEAFGRPASG